MGIIMQIWQHVYRKAKWSCSVRGIMIRSRSSLRPKFSVSLMWSRRQSESVHAGALTDKELCQCRRCCIVRGSKRRTRKKSVDWRGTRLSSTRHNSDRVSRNRILFVSVQASYTFIYSPWNRVLGMANLSNLLSYVVSLTRTISQLAWLRLNYSLHR